MQNFRLLFFTETGLKSFLRHHRLVLHNNHEIVKCSRKFCLKRALCFERKIKNEILFNFNYIRDVTNRHKLFSIPVAEYAPFHIRFRTLKVNLLSLIFLFLSLHVFTGLEFDSNHFGFLLWKMVKPRDHNEIKPTIGKIFRKYKPIRHYFVMSRK